LLPLMNRRFLTLLLALPLAGCGDIQKALAPDPALVSPSPSPTETGAIASPSSSPSPTPSSSPSPSSSPNASPSSSPNASPSNYTQDLQQLNLLPKTLDGQKAITRREYSRALMAANNRLYQASSAKQIRPAGPSEAVYTDIPKTDPDFSTIQGLAEAGILPSKLSGEATATQFRPDAPLTREDLIIWKVPLDTRSALPSATIDAIQKTWGFQDAEKISPRALRALLVDHQNGDQSNLRRALGYTTLFQPKRAVTNAEAAAVLWSFGFQGDITTAKDALKGP
jgi:hypothetical protein